MGLRLQSTGSCDKIGRLSDDSDDVTVDGDGRPYDTVDGDCGWAGMQATK